MSGKVFFDTNILIYAVTEDDPRSYQAEELLGAGGVINVQVLNEFVAVASRKLRMPWPDVREAREAFLEICPDPSPVTLELHRAASQIAEQDGCGISHALIVAAALQERCTVLYSEDFQDGRIFEGKLEVRNPFRARK